VYLTADSLRKSIERNSYNFSIIHVNCRSLKKNFDSLTLLLGELVFLSLPFVYQKPGLYLIVNKFIVFQATLFTVNPDLEKLVVVLVFMYKKVLTV